MSKFDIAMMGGPVLTGLLVAFFYLVDDHIETGKRRFRSWINQASMPKADDQNGN